MRKTLLVLALLVVGTSLHAAESYMLRPFAPGARPMGMGGAFVALADDHDLFYFNPAGVSRIPGNLFTLDFPFALNENIIEFYQSFWDRREEFENADDLPADQQVDTGLAVKAASADEKIDEPALDPHRR